MRIGIVSDIHGRPRDLAAALVAIGPVDQLLCLGDSIGQSRFCNDTVAMLRTHAALTILGNHEEAFFAGHGRHAAHIDRSLADWLAARPQRIDIVLGGRRVTMVHSTPWPSGHAYVAPTHPDFPRFGGEDADLLLYGHTHMPTIKQVGATLVVNPGSVGEGRPTDDGFVRSCAVVDLATLSAEILDLD